VVDEDETSEMTRRKPGLVEFERLYERDFRSFVRVARAIVGDAQLAVDAVHDGFVAAIRGRDGYRGDGPFEAWVWRAVVNAARKGRAARAGVLPLLSVDALGETREDRDELRLASVLLALPERQRLIVFLRYYADPRLPRDRRHARDRGGDGQRHAERRTSITTQSSSGG
jgi:RNA polymerase sigma factor (sigma-70 family)